jgi:hypothetical protein
MTVPISPGTMASFKEVTSMTIKTLPITYTPDESIDASLTAWTSAFCSTWDALVHGTSDLVDLADWADALYAAHGDQDPCKVARDVFEESERCG